MSGWADGCNNRHKGIWSFKSYFGALGDLASFGFLKYKKNDRDRIGEQGTDFCCQLRATEYWCDGFSEA